MGIIDTNYAKILKYYIENCGVDVTETIINKIIVSLKHSGYHTFHSIVDDCVYYFIKVNSVNKSVKKIINKIPDNFDPKKNSKFLIIVNNIQDKFYINTPEFKKDFKTTLSEKYSLPKRINTIKDISAEFIGTSSKKHEIEITSRIDSLEYTLNNTADDKTTPLGQVYIAALVDIVNMYNSIGDSLFDFNVRYKISDELDVENEITKTLTEKPKEFWFNNNGITIIVNKDKFNCNRPRTIELCNSNCFSVVNGAQTITTAAKWLNENEENKNNLKDAWVLLRIISVSDIELSFAKDISVSLNRQKSISAVDIVTTYPFVETINTLMNDCDDDNICFELSKRGGTPTYKYSYYIDDFAQLVEAYLIQKPGSARTSKGALISIKDNVFVRKDIFKDIKTSEEISKYYSPTNYAYELNKTYKKIKINQSTLDSYSDIIYKYGNMYCIASVIYCINHKNVDDFSSFGYIDLNNNAHIIKKFVDCFEAFLLELNPESLDSNDFKKEELYKKFKKSNHMEELFEYIEKFKTTNNNRL